MVPILLLSDPPHSSVRAFSFFNTILLVEKIVILHGKPFNADAAKLVFLVLKGGLSHYKTSLRL